MCHTEQDSWIIHRQSVVILLDPKLAYFHCKWSKRAKLFMILHSTSLHNTGRYLFLCICSHRWLETDGYDSCDNGNIDKFNFALDVHTTYRVFMSAKILLLLFKLRTKIRSVWMYVQFPKSQFSNSGFECYQRETSKFTRSDAIRSQQEEECVMKERVYQVRGEGEAHSIIAPAAQKEQQM